MGARHLGGTGLLPNPSIWPPNGTLSASWLARGGGLDNNGVSVIETLKSQRVPAEAGCLDLTNAPAPPQPYPTASTADPEAAGGV